jgi:hypothetical protein
VRPPILRILPSKLLDLSVAPLASVGITYFALAQTTIIMMEKMEIMARAL